MVAGLHIWEATVFTGKWQCIQKKRVLSRFAAEKVASVPGQPNRENIIMPLTVNMVDFGDAMVVHPSKSLELVFQRRGLFSDPITGALNLPLNLDFLGFLKVLTIKDLGILGFLEVVLQDSNWTGPMLD